MSLLQHRLPKTYEAIADDVYERHLRLDEKLSDDYDDYRLRKMYEDTLHNLSFLYVASRINDGTLFKKYTAWLFNLMVYLMPDLSVERIREQMLVHYRLLKEAFIERFTESDALFILKLLDQTIDMTQTMMPDADDSSFIKDKYNPARETYLSYLQAQNPKRAVSYVKELLNQFSIEEIYVDILQAVMVEIGSLWQRNKISVDQEHYMTSITQIALSQFYDLIFDRPKNGKKLLACGIGSELHEIGIRMISDLFEYHGFDTIYLGAAVPQKAILKSIAENQPDIIAFSVTMPQHLLECQDVVSAVREMYPDVKIAVGGRAFTLTDNLWKSWPIDYYALDAKALLHKALESVVENNA